MSMTSVIYLHCNFSLYCSASFYGANPDLTLVSCHVVISSSCLICATLIMIKQALANPQVLQNYYAQLYGLTSPTASPYHHHQYIGYVAPPPPTPPRAAILPPPAAAQQVAVQPLLQHPPPAQQVTVQPLLQHPPAQIHQASFFPAPSLSHNFRLQLPPPQALSVLPPNTTGVYCVATEINISTR